MISEFSARYGILYISNGIVVCIGGLERVGVMMLRFEEQDTDLSSDELAVLIRQALEIRVAGAEQPKRARDELLKRARGISRQGAGTWGSPFERVAVAPDSPNLLLERRGFSTRVSGLSLAISQLTNPIISLLR